MQIRIKLLVVALLVTPGHGARKVDLASEGEALQLANQLVAHTYLQHAGSPDKDDEVFQAKLSELGLSLVVETVTPIPPLDETVIRYQQLYCGIPVVGGEIVSALEHDARAGPGVPAVTAGTLVTGLEGELGCPMGRLSVSERDAIDMAKRTASEPKAAARAASSVRKVIHIGENDKAEAAWEVTLRHESLVYERQILISAENGRKLEDVDLVMSMTARSAETGLPPGYLPASGESQQTMLWNRAPASVPVSAKGTGPGGNGRTGRYEYGTGNKPYLDITQRGSQCSLENDLVRTTHSQWNPENVQDPEYPTHTFECVRQDSDTGGNGAFSPLNDAHHHVTNVIKMIKSWYGQPYVKTPLTMRTHCSTGSFAFLWVAINSIVIDDSMTLVFDDRLYVVYPPATAMILAHEFAHAVVAATSRLVYWNEAGGLNEAFADITGATARFHYEPETADFMAGEELFKPPLPPRHFKNNSYIRCMDNPTCDGLSIDNAKDYRDGINPHFSSGVFNKAFYLLSTTLGGGIREAYDIMFKANLKFWKKHSGFADAAGGVFAALADLKRKPWPGRTYEHVAERTLAQAFAAVGITCSANGTSPWTCHV